MSFAPARVGRRARRGQIFIPSLLVLPSLFLFVYLIFETAKLSREKIRHQFAVDAASFVEMTNYSDFLNRTAYVNGAFPMRIFEEGFRTTFLEYKNAYKGGEPPKSLYQVLYENGAFPQTSDEHGGDVLNQQKSWGIEFGGPNAESKNGANPDFSNPSGDSPADGNHALHLTTMKNAEDYWLSWDDAKDIYNLYVQIYQLLGSVEDAQYSVFQRLTKEHSFFHKSYYLNSQTKDLSESREAGRAFNKLKATASCIKYIIIHGNQATSHAFQPYQVYWSKPPMEMPVTLPTMGCDDEGQNSKGLFQVATVNPADIKRLGEVDHSAGCGSAVNTNPGYQVSQRYPAPENYFGIKFNDRFEGKPCVHATVGLTGGKVWPQPTPKFQTRLYP